LILLIAVEGAFYARRYLTCVPHEQVWPQTDYRGFLGIDEGLFRIAPVSRATINYGWAAPLQLQMITGYDPYNYRHYWPYFELLTTGQILPAHVRVWADLRGVARWDLLDIMNVAYLIAPQPLSAEASRLTSVARLPDRPIYAFYRGMTTADLYVYHNPHAQPRAYWARAVIGARDEEALALAQRTDLHELTIVHAADHSPVTFDISADDQVEVSESWDGHLDLQTQSEQKRFLVISEIWHPGWRADLDGKPLPLHRANLALLGAWIPPGRHRLTLHHHQPYWRLGALITLAAVAICLLLWLYTRRKRLKV
ncbi:MAG: YfhO family protein, partial [Alphaproteobacteria bacterium]